MRMNFLRKYFFVLIALVCIAVNLCASSAWIEKYYARGLYLLVRIVFDSTLFLLPVAGLYFLAALLLFSISKFLIIFFNKKLPINQRILQAILYLLRFAGGVVSAFYILWGFNYARIPLKQQINLTLTVPDSSDLKKELILSAQETEVALLNFKNSVQPIGLKYLEKKELEDTVRAAVFKTLNNLNLPISGKPRGREIKPTGIMFRFGISGIYLPFTGEANIDAANPVLEKPFTLAHEMCHGMGWTDEGTCNFLAYLACTESENTFLKYSGFISYYRYAAPAYRRVNNEDYKKFREILSPELRRDLDDINKTIQKYPVWFSSDALNDTFLKSQGVKAGINSYNQVILLVRAWRTKKNNLSATDCRTF